MTDQTKLLPCPVCGKAPEFRFVQVPRDWHVIECTDAEPNIWHDVGSQGHTAAVAVERWNKMVERSHERQR